MCDIQATQVNWFPSHPKALASSFAAFTESSSSDCLVDERCLCGCCLQPMHVHAVHEFTFSWRERLDIGHFLVKTNLSRALVEISKTKTAWSSRLGCRGHPHWFVPVPRWFGTSDWILSWVDPYSYIPASYHRHCVVVQWARRWNSKPLKATLHINLDSEVLKAANPCSHGGGRRALCTARNWTVCGRTHIWSKLACLPASNSVVPSNLTYRIAMLSRRV